MATSFCCYPQGSQGLLDLRTPDHVYSSLCLGSGTDAVYSRNAPTPSLMGIRAPESSGRASLYLQMLYEKGGSTVQSVLGNELRNEACLAHAPFKHGELGTNQDNRSGCTMSKPLAATCVFKVCKRPGQAAAFLDWRSTGRCSLWCSRGASTDIGITSKTDRPSN